MYFDFLIVINVSSYNMEEAGFMTYTTTRHQVAMDINN